MIKSRIKFLISVGLLAALHFSAGAQSGSADFLSIHYVDPLEKIFRETAFFQEREARADVARGEHVSVQYAVRSLQPVKDLRAKVDYIRKGGDQLSASKVGFVGYVRVGRSTPRPSRDRLMPASGFYPDPILEQEAIDLSAFTTQPVWITIPIPVDARPGTYQGKATFSGTSDGKQFSVSREFSIEVYPVAVENTSLWVTNWYNLSPNTLAYLNDGVPVEPFTDLYWKLVREIAKTMAEYRQNVVIINPLQLTQYDFEGEQYRFDFANFDKTVEIFIEEGAVGRIEGGHIGGRATNWTSPFLVSVPVIEKDTSYFESLNINDRKAARFYSQFFPALVSHLKEKGWYDRYMQHIADEPITENLESYIEIAAFVKKLAPDIKIVEACHTRDLDNTVDIWVPQLNFLNEDYSFYQERMAAGDEVWHYTCLAPQEEYANRFVELPLIKTRILHWINFRYDIPGYLHWGLNFWRGDPFVETTGIITESGNVLPGGDAWIVYPAKGKILSSIRLEAMRDGIVDYELLKMAAAKEPEAVKELARQVVYRFDLYDMNIEAFREKRRELLRRISGG